MLAPVGGKEIPSTFEVIEEAVRLRIKGVSVLHFQSISSEDKQLSYNIEPYSQAIAWLRESSDILMEFPAWGTLKHSLEERVAPLVLKPDFIEIIPGSINLGDQVIYNPLSYIDFIIQVSSEVFVKPVFNVFSPSMLIYVRNLIDRGKLNPPYIFTLTFTEEYFPPTIDNLLYIYKLLPQNSKWFLSVKGKTSGSLFAVALELGGNIRVGLEDWCDGQDLTNERLVTEVLRIATSLGFEPATPKETSEILGKVM
ncbi:MAG: 3-keto-5-aminohexanoate cleavage protein [Synergistetes bacterium]|nr:3-keto-5-aminohexanoate cleavage protein [Synergistota bacterium]